MLEEKLAAAKGNGRRTARVLLEVPQMEEVVAQVFLGDLLW
jgi:hypothetical protein